VEIDRPEVDSGVDSISQFLNESLVLWQVAITSAQGEVSSIGESLTSTKRGQVKSKAKCPNHF
jgi:hypothetical protein